MTAKMYDILLKWGHIKKIGNGYFNEMNVMLNIHLNIEKETSKVIQMPNAE